MVKKALIALLYLFILFIFKNAAQGAQTNLYCLVEDDSKLIKGGYYVDFDLIFVKYGVVFKVNILQLFDSSLLQIYRM